MEYVLLFTKEEHINWDASFTLGSCGIVICYLSWRFINELYQHFKKPIPEHGKLPAIAYNVVMGISITVITYFGMTCAVTLLGFWSATVLHELQMPQGVLFPYSRQGLVPYVH